VLVVASSALWSVVPWLLRAGIDEIRAGRALARVLLIGGAMIGVSLAGGALRYYMRELLNGVSRWVEFDLRDDLFAHLTRLDAGWYGRTRTGEIMARLTNDLSAVRMAAGPAIMYLMNTIAGGAFALVFMVRIDAKLTLLALLPMLALPALAIWLGGAIHRRFEAVQEHFGVMTTRVQENLSGTRVVRAYRQEHAEEARFAALGEEYLRRNMRLAKLYGAMNPSFSLLAGIGAVIVLGYGGALTVQGRISVGSLVAFGMYLSILTWPLIALGWVINLFQRGAASMTRLVEILDAEPAVQDARATRVFEPTGRGRTIEFRAVGFHYPHVMHEREPRWVLRDVSFVVPAGATLGVVGATGSGKSALMDLIPRNFDPQEGEILIDGIPIREIPLDKLRREIGYVPQESLLFSETIAANLGYGLDDADARDVEWAARAAQLDETIREFPGGYETMLGERGINLSGGQKQRAALARALARNPGIVLLDDSLSAVDTHTEAQILHALRDVVAGRTTVVSSHRVSAVRDATLIIVLDSGRIVEQGRHRDLLALGGRYATLLQRQQLVDAIESEGDALAAVAGGATP
jgi:ATP-binding cassette subfamily B protein